MTQLPQSPYVPRGHSQDGTYFTLQCSYSLCEKEQKGFAEVFAVDSQLI